MVAPAARGAQSLELEQEAYLNLGMGSVRYGVNPCRSHTGCNEKGSHINRTFLQRLKPSDRLPECACAAPSAFVKHGLECRGGGICKHRKPIPVLPGNEELLAASLRTKGALCSNGSAAIVCTTPRPSPPHQGVLYSK
ncbi:hypothetical protein CEXT_706861 [Caerostris extrusa]|uniref:Uncharacterized protein n=1 Tax=Caerostris extrusa TaxID=172846 RepID=A0AAV4PYC0_CAEEX|nr:hypothetical protein CEXT_706861 [Caerostris extrusa]